MKRFTEYLNEDFDPAIYNSDGAISINDPTVIDAMNSNLDASTSSSFRTPYNALEEVRKVLAYYKIFLPKSIFLDQNHGNDVFEISQFGEKMGMNNDGEVVAASDSSLFLYFEWSMDEKGMYDAFASVVNDEELEEIMTDFDAEVEDDESELNESIAEKTKMLYKLVNKMNAEKQMTEMPMPNLKKKMDAKKATLPNMMKEDDMDKFDDDDKPKKPKKAKEYEHETSKKRIMHTGTPPKDYKLVKESEQLNELSKKTLGNYIKKASHDVATKSAATGRYADRANKARDEMKKGDYKNWPQGKKDDEFADKMFKKSWKRRKGIAKAVDKITK
jgi:hypothetical protein